MHLPNSIVYILYFLLRNIWLWLWLMTCSNTWAQDPQFTQFYAAPLFLNPATTGMGMDMRVTANYRDQWSGLPSNFRTYMAAVDHYFPTKSFSAGLMVKEDLQGANAGAPLQQLSVQVSGAYLLSLSDVLRLNMGLQLGVVQTSLNTHSLLFGDQFSESGAVGVTREVLPSSHVIVPDIGSGAMLFGPQMWVGISLQHVNRPRIAFFKNSEVNHLSTRFSIQAGYQIPLARHKRKKELFRFDDFILTPTMLYKAQGKWDQLSIGTYLESGPAILGTWYRGIPYLKRYDKQTLNQDAFSLLAGLKLQHMRIGYSYDVTLSELPMDKAGSHEISISYLFKTQKNYRVKPKKKKQEVVCPIPWI